MTNIRKFAPRDDSYLDEAADWIAAIERGISEDEETELGNWLRCDDANLKTFIELAELWDDLDALEQLSDLFPESRRPNRVGRILLPLATAATLVLAFGLYIDPQNPDSTESEPAPAVASQKVTSFKTAIGEQATHELPDGSVIVLNTDSSARVEFTSRNRKVFLDRGEIHIRVAHDPFRRLSVLVGDTVVQAVGTEFNVEITADDNIELVVTEGIVMVGVIERGDTDAVEDAPILLAQTSELISAGKETTLSRDSSDDIKLVTEQIEGEDIAIKLSWREGNLIFRGESLEEAVNEVGRYTAVEFVFVDEEAKQVRVAGLYKAGDVDGLLAALRSHFNVTYEWRDDKTILLGSNE